VLQQLWLYQHGVLLYADSRAEESDTCKAPSSSDDSVSTLHQCARVNSHALLHMQAQNSQHSAQAQPQIIFDVLTCWTSYIAGFPRRLNCKQSPEPSTSCRWHLQIATAANISGRPTTLLQEQPTIHKCYLTFKMHTCVEYFAAAAATQSVPLCSECIHVSALPTDVSAIGLLNHC
jgi:hypothetical protein